MNQGQRIGELTLRIAQLEDLLAGKGIEPEASKRLRELQVKFDAETKGRAVDAAAHKAREAELLAGIARLRGNGATLPSPVPKPVTPAAPAGQPIDTTPQPPHYKRHNATAKILALLTESKKKMRAAEIRAAFPTIPEPNISVALGYLVTNRKIQREGEFRKYLYFTEGAE